MAFEQISARTEEPLLQLLQANTALIERSSLLYGHSVTSPVEKMPAVKYSVMLDLNAITTMVNPMVARVMTDYLQAADAAAEEDSDVVGIAALTALKSMMAGYHSPETLQQMGVPLSMLNVYFTLEKFSDDFGRIDNETGTFLYPNVVSAFEQACLALLREDMDFETALQMMLQQIGSTEHVTTEISEIIAKLVAGSDEEKLAIIEAHAPGFTTDPNLYFLVMNLVSLHLLQVELKKIRDRAENQGFAVIAQKGIEGLTNRYIATREILNNPAMPIEEAIEVGKHSILTDTFAGFVAMAADVDPEFRVQLEQNGDLVTGVVDEASYLIRMLNDGGSTVEVSIETTRPAIDQMRDLLGRDLTPRQLFAKLETLTAEMIDAENPQLWAGTLKSWKDLCSRYIKDAHEAEYNSILNSGMTHNDIEADWQTFGSNLEYAANAFKRHLENFRRLITELNISGEAIAEFFGRFVLFNHELYGLLGGDYDRANVPWHKLRSMNDRSPSSWQAEYLIISGEPDERESVLLPEA